MTGFHHHANGDRDHHHDNPEHENHHDHRSHPDAGGRPAQVPVPARSRRAFLGDFGRGTLAMAVFTPLLAACGSNGETDQSAGPDASDETGSATSATTESPSAAVTDDDDVDDDGDGDVDGDGEESTGGLLWARANLGFVSAYVLARGNAAAIVDTGSAGSADAIGATLQTLGLGYQDVDHVILTHRHGDHIGSINEVLANTPAASVYAGQADLGQIDIDTGSGFDPDKIIALNGGEDIFGFETIATPGHTAGHMAAIDRTAGILVAGDAIFTEGGVAIEGPERFFEDVEASRRSIAQLAELSFNTLLIGHGDPLESGADEAVAALAASLL